jgi:hypothetical protein
MTTMPRKTANGFSLQRSPDILHLSENYCTYIYPLPETTVSGQKGIYPKSLKLQLGDK